MDPVKESATGPSGQEGAPLHIIGRLDIGGMLILSEVGITRK